MASTGSPSPCRASGGSSSTNRSPSPWFTGAECLCPTCQYYKAVYLYHQECHSPTMDSYQMYQYAYAGQSSISPEAPSDFAASTIEQFQQSIGHLAALACSAAGRSLLQSVMRLQHLDKIQIIFDELMTQSDTVLLDTHGCHVVRSLIEVLDEHQVAKLVGSLNPTLILNMCTLSQYTRRILQTLFERHRPASLQGIVDILAVNVQYLAATQQGCISLMRIFERASSEQKEMLIHPLLPHLSDLACDPFGNYVVQCALENSDQNTANTYISEFLLPHVVKLSCNKFASNVMEKTFRVATISTRRMLLDEIVFNPAALQQLIQDAFGNFVIQTAIETATTTGELKKIHDRLRPILPQCPYGHKIEAKIRGKRFIQSSSFPTPKNQAAAIVAC